MKKKRLFRLAFFMTAFSLALLSMSDMSISASDSGIEEILFNSALELFESGKTDKAMEDINRILQLNPEHEGARFYAGKDEYHQGNYSQALRYLTPLTNHPKYGHMAKIYLTDIKIYNYKQEYSSKIEKYKLGNSYEKAYQAAVEALAQMPHNTEVLYEAVYLATALGYANEAKTYLNTLNKLSGNSPEVRELTRFASAWQKDGVDTEQAIDILMNLEDSRLNTRAVKSKIVELVYSIGSIEIFQQFFENEVVKPNANTQELENHFVKLLIKEEKYERAIEMLEKRPMSSIDDHILRISLINELQEYEKALTETAFLLRIAPRELKLFDLWMRSWVYYFDKHSKEPLGQNDKGQTFSSITEWMLNILKPEIVVTQAPELLVNMMRASLLTNNSEVFSSVAAFVPEADFSNISFPYIQKVITELEVFYKDREATKILEGLVKQFPTEYNLKYSLANQYFKKDDYFSSIVLLEQILKDRPEMIRAFMLWVDANVLSGQKDFALNALLERINDDSTNPLIKRQLTAKFEMLRAKDQKKKNESDLIVSITY